MYRSSSRPIGTCPVCARSLVRRLIVGETQERCPDGDGVWLDEGAFAALWLEMTGGAPFDPGSLRPLDETTARGRDCPTCRSPMARVSLLAHPSPPSQLQPQAAVLARRGVPLSRCPLDGLWFEGDALEIALAGAALPPVEWLGLFAPRLARLR